jgi:hypothetical protein
MTSKYFQTFPIINYSNNQVVDITKRVVVQEKVIKNPYVYYPYEITDNERADQLSNSYYEDPYKSWIIYLSNKITDPYYEWYLQYNEFEEFVKTKYGSMDNAINKISYYANDWVSSEDISVSAYDALTASQQNYWEPLYSVSGSISSYTRKKIDWKRNTNRIVSYQVSNTSFINDELCHVVFGSNTAAGQVVAANNGTLYLQHVIGNYDGPYVSGSYVYGLESGVNTSITSTINVVSTNIPAEEQVYWKEVSYFTYETERNEYFKSLTILDKAYSDITYENLRTLMAE